MPSKKPKARWDYRPPGHEEREPFDDSLVRELAKIAGCEQDFPKMQSLAERLADESSALQMVDYVFDTETSLAEQHEALKVLAPLARKLFDLVNAADLSTRREIFTRYPAARIGDETIDRERTTGLDLFSRDIEHLNRLRRGIEFALADIGEARKADQGGKPGNPHLDKACEKLAAVYAEYSGKKFTYDREPGSGDLSEFITPGGLFVAIATQSLYPDATLANLHTAMQKIRRQ